MCNLELSCPATLADMHYKLAHESWLLADHDLPQQTVVTTSEQNS